MTMVVGLVRTMVKNEPIHVTSDSCHQGELLGARRDLYGHGAATKMRREQEWILSAFSTNIARTGSFQDLEPQIVAQSTGSDLN